MKYNIKTKSSTKTKHKSAKTLDQSYELWLDINTCMYCTTWLDKWFRSETFSSSDIFIFFTLTRVNCSRIVLFFSPYFLFSFHPKTLPLSLSYCYCYLFTVIYLLNEQQQQQHTTHTHTEQGRDNNNKLLLLLRRIPIPRSTMPLSSILYCYWLLTSQRPLFLKWK